MVSASSARPRFPRPACKSSRRHPTVSSAPIKSSAGNARPAILNDGPLPLNRYLIYFGLAAVGCAVDLLTKEAVFRWRGLPRANNPWWLIDGRFGIETSVNPGALFGMGAGW